MRLPKFELRRLASGVKVDGRRPVRLPGDAAAMLGPILCGAEAELALALLLDGRHRALGVVEVARGAANVVHLEPRELYRMAIHVGAVALVLAHNHPSGDVLPSTDDVALTNRIRAAGEVVGVALVEHLILTDCEFFSFSTSRRGRWAPPRRRSARWKSRLRARSPFP